MDSVQCGLRIVALLQRGDPRNNIVVVDDSPVQQVRGPAKSAETNLLPLGDDAKILYPDRSTAFCSDDRVSDVLNVFDAGRPREH